jgi:3-phosphoshikimate 1-carboxyvinyltransferase
MNHKSITISIDFLEGVYNAPSSKSHMFRALFLSLISKKSRIYNPLYNNDTNVLIDIFIKMGAIVDKNSKFLNIYFPKIDILKEYYFENSGTALRFMTTYLASIPRGNSFHTYPFSISGDEQLKKRRIEPLLISLEKLGLKYSKLSKNDLPFIIENGIKGGETSISGKSSQFLSSLLLNLPFLERDSIIKVKELHELPYIDITLWWLDKFDIKYKNDSYSHFNILGDQKLYPFEVIIPGDYSSASFIILASVLNGDVEIRGLDKDDPQGDKFILTFLERVGISINYTENGFNLVGKVNRGGEFDLNDTPDLLPALALFSVNYNYDFKFYNVESARFKETDRISSIVKVLKSLGVVVNEFKDGLSFKGGLKRRSNYVSGFNDHRIIMASSLLGIKKGYNVIINDIKNIEGSYPSYFKDLESLT